MLLIPTNDNNFFLSFMIHIWAHKELNKKTLSELVIKEVVIYPEAEKKLFLTTISAIASVPSR